MRWWCLEHCKGPATESLGSSTLDVGAAVGRVSFEHLVPLEGDGDFICAVWGALRGSAACLGWRLKGNVLRRVVAHAHEK